MANSRQRRLLRRAAKATLSKRVLDRYRWFRWLISHRKTKRWSGWGGIVAALYIAYEALGKEVDGAVKTAAVMFFVAWTVFAFAVYISDWWVKHRVTGSGLVISVLIASGLFWWFYLPPPPAQQVVRTPAPELEIIKRLESELDRAQLLRKYPLGYAIFYVDREERVILYDAKALTEFELDWDTVSLAQHPDPKVETVILTMPAFRRKGDAQAFPKIGLMGPRRVGIINCNMVPDSNWERTLSVCGEILSIEGRTIVFLVGVKQLRLPA